ncbi:glycosyltransferase family 2 protein [Blastococcus sp. SYSU DS0539]
MPNLDVVVPAYGDAERLRRLLLKLQEEATANQSHLRVIVSDDGSPVPLSDGLDADEYPALELHVLRGPNGGPGAARNRGLSAATAQWVAFLDADTVPADGWLGVLRGLLIKGADVDAYEGTVGVPSEGATPFSHATEIDSDVAHGGANIVYRREALLAINGFSEDFYDAKRGVHFREDIDLYFRALDANLRIVAVPELVALHPPLDSSFLTPMRLARRYYFDALLDRNHALRFRQVNMARRIGPISLRAARHGAAVSHVSSVLLVLAGISCKSRGVAKLGAFAAAGTWVANMAAIGWGKHVRPADLGGVSVAAIGTSWVYTWHYYRGVVHFRHRPRLR